jgi:acyl dehydratase
MAKAYYKTSSIGDLITPLVKNMMTRTQFVKFAAATKDYNPLHFDDDHGHMQGYGGAFAQGNLVLGHLEEALYNYAGNGRLVHLVGTFHKLVWPGDLLTAKGLVSDKYKHNDEHRIDLEVWIENQNHDIVIKGQATYLLWDSPKEESLHTSPLPPLSESSKTDTTKMIRAKLAHLSLKEVPDETDETEVTIAPKSPKKARH